MVYKGFKNSTVRVILAWKPISFWLFKIFKVLVIFLPGTTIYIKGKILDVFFQQYVHAFHGSLFFLMCKLISYLHFLYHTVEVCGPDILQWKFMEQRDILCAPFAFLMKLFIFTLVVNNSIAKQCSVFLFCLI